MFSNLSLRARVGVALVALLLAPAAFDAAAQAPTTGNAKAARKADAPAARGFLWEARRGEARLWLFGSIHVGRESFATLRPQVQAAVRDAASVVFEVDVFDSQKVGPVVQRIAYYADGEPGLDQRLAPEMIRRIETLLARSNLDFRRVARMKPWTLANTLVLLDASRAGLSPVYSTEAVLSNAAREAGKPLGELETIELQLNLFDAAPEALQLAYLEQAVRGIEKGDTGRELARIVAAWEKRDTADMEKLVATMRSATGPAERFVIDTIIEGRHPRMLERIDELAASGKPHLVIVGALHYFGPAGLLDGLRARGYTIRAL